jgi:hypothetical protein
MAVAAEILKEQHTPGEDWLLAIGRYHRPAGGEPAARYRRSVSRHLARVQGTRPAAAALPDDLLDDAAAAEPDAVATGADDGAGNEAVP